MNIIQVYPARLTPRGRRRPPEYLYRFNYPGLLSGQAPTVTTTQQPSDALSYKAGEEDALASALLLLRSLGYNPKVETQ